MPGNANPLAEMPQPSPVEGNNWRALDPPALGSWHPQRTVSVVIPYYNDRDALVYTLEGLEAQSYPRDLFEVIIADDGSSILPDLESCQLQVRMVGQRDRGYRAGAARNLGARIARGEILVFLDSDMVPERSTIEAHARWHHLVADAVTLGFRTHVPFDGLKPQDVRTAVHQGSMEALLEGRERRRPEYLEMHMQRTKDLVGGQTDIFRVVTSGNQAMRAETYFRVGGYDDTFDRWGGEDTEFGYRLFNDGCLLIPERAAECWHQGIGSFEDPGHQRVLEIQRAKMAHLIPHPGFRRHSPGRRYHRPTVLVIVRTGNAPADVLTATIEAILASSFHDLHVLVDIPSTHAAVEWVRNQFAPDPRVDVGSGVDPDRDAPHVPIQVTVPASCVVAFDTIERIVAEIGTHVGVLYITIPGTRPLDGMILVVWTRAMRRGRRLDGAEAVKEAGSRFGERWASGREFGLGLGENTARRSVKPSPSNSGELAIAQQFFSGLTAEQRTVLIGLAQRAAKGLAALQTARTADSVRESAVAVRQFGGAFAPAWLRRLLYRFVYPLYRRMRGHARKSS